MHATTRALALLTLTGCATTEIAPAPVYPTEASDTAVIWNGFRHDWSYNHRLNRMGNWVGPQACDGAACTVELGHAAASGLGSDTATWTTRATAVHAPGVGFLPGVTTFRVDEPRAEGRLIERTRTVTVPLDGLLADRAGYAVLLQGYDVMALEDADMFTALSIEVGGVTVDREAGTVSFDASIGLQVDCDALECDGTWDIGGKVRKDVDYGVHLMWLVVGSDAADAGVTCEARSGAYRWDDDDRDAELALEAGTVDGVLTGAADAPRSARGVLGLQALSIALDHESHMVSLATGVVPGAWDARTGTAAYSLELFFKQWNATSWDRATSYTTSGSAATAGTVCLMTLDDADVAPVGASGAIRWEADGAPATDARAVDAARIPMTFDARR